MNKISNNQLERYPLYLKYFKELESEGITLISASVIGNKLGYSQEQVRKDLQAISSIEGKPKKGREIKQLIDDLETFLGYKKIRTAVVMGVGRLGGALMHYPYFEEYGLQIVAGFDKEASKLGLTDEGKTVYSCDDFSSIMKEIKADIAIISVPASQAQRVVNLAIDNGVKGIWNFAPTHIVVPEGIALENVNLSSSLAILTHKLK